MLKVLLLITLLSTWLCADTLTFSSTQQWEKSYLECATTKPHYLEKGWEQRLMPAHPPANDSTTTREELDALLEAQRKRTKENVQRILRERPSSGQQFLGSFPLSQNYQKKKPHTYALLNVANKELAKTVFYYKKQFNRVRPSFLETELSIAIPNPNHPAYPSGHATQAMVFALLLAEIHPDKREQLIRDAKSIGTNREIAGVHYRSDSVAGYALAAKLVTEWKKHPSFNEMLLKAKKEHD